MWNGQVICELQIINPYLGNIRFAMNSQIPHLCVAREPDVLRAMGNKIMVCDTALRSFAARVGNPNPPPPTEL